MASSNRVLSVWNIQNTQIPVPEGAYSVMIPWAETWVTEDRIIQEFQESGFGNVAKVDMVYREQGKRPHQKVFIHITEINEEYKQHLEAGNEIKIHYNGTYFWKVRKSNYRHNDQRDTPKNKIELC